MRALLAAAIDSPGGGHRLPSLTLMWLRSVSRPPTGEVIARERDMPRLLSAARSAAPQVGILEDCWAPDPRLVTRFQVGGRRFRLHPGALPDPLASLRSVTATAEAIDGFVLNRHGFRLSDLVEVALRYCDHRLSVIALAWPVEDLARDRDAPEGESLRARVRRIGRAPVVVTEAEVAASASAGIEADDWIGACEYPDRAAVAWAWCTKDAADVRVDLYPGAGKLGSVLAVRSQGAACPVPSALVIGAVATAAVMLAGEAAADEESARRMQTVTVRRAVRASGHPAAAVPADSFPGDLGNVVSGAPLLSVIVPASRHAFVLGYASGLDSTALARSMDEAVAAVNGVTPDQVREADGNFDPAGSVFRVVIYGAPVHGPFPVYKGTACIPVDEYVVAAMDADQVATGEMIGRDLLWQFLDELTTMPGVQELHAWDFRDIWQVWRDRGTLNPGGRQGIIVYPFVAPGQEAWERAAEWEPLETVLTDAGLPPSWVWTYAHIDEEGQATVGDRGEVFLVLAAPSLVVHVTVDEGIGTLGIDPAFAVGVADGIRQTVAGNAGVAAAMSAGTGPLVCHLLLEVQRTAGAPADAVGCKLRAVSGPPPVIDLAFGADWIECLAADPAGGHAVLGRALAEGLRGALGLTDAACEAFHAAWTEAVPVAMLRSRQTALPPSFEGRYRLPRSVATEARARRQIATAIVRSDVPRQVVYAAAGAVGICTDVILPAANEALASAIAGWSAAAVLAVARSLNDAHAHRNRRAGDLALALTAPWGTAWQQFAQQAPEPVMITRPLELLLEMLLVRTTSGNVDADAIEIAEVADLAAAGIEASLYLDATRNRLHDLVVIVDDEGQFAIRDQEPDTPTSMAIDLGAYLQAARSDRLRLRPEPVAGSPIQLTTDASRPDTEFVLLEDVNILPSFVTADSVMHRELGTGTDGLRAVLGTAVNWTPDGGDEVVEITRAELRDAAAAWSRLPASDIESALDLLVLTADKLRAEGMPYWELERRAYRLPTRPLISLPGGGLLIIPRLIAAAQETYAAYLTDGRLPWPSSSLPRAVVDAFNNYRGRQNAELERQVLDALRSLGLPCRGNIEPHEAASLGLQLTGEIDALAADPQRSRLWVCEVKDVFSAASPRTLADRVKKFTKTDGYLHQVLRSHREIQANPGVAARLLGVADPDRDWRVIPLMVTRHIEPAAFVYNQSVMFVVVEDLPDLLQASDLPPPGHNPGSRLVP